MAEAGVTSVHEAGMSAADPAAFRALAERDELRIRIYGKLNGNGSRTDVLTEPYHDAPDHAAPAERISPQRIAELRCG
jgi:predicted amidohydrolase YtcJ